MANHGEYTYKQDDLTKLMSEMAVGGGAGFATGGPIGGAVGAAAPLVNRGLLRAVREFRERVLGQREAFRVLTVAQYAKAKYEKNIMEGKQLRSDDFFLEDEATGRSSADEIIEGTFLAAQREHEERKVPYYANLAANLPFEPAVDRYTANLLLRTAQEISYRQLCLLALVAKKNEHVLPDVSHLVNGATWEAWSAKKELSDLEYQSGLITVVASHEGGSSRRNIGVPADLDLTSEGRALYELMQLTDVPNGELYKLSAVLREGAGMNNVGD